MWIDLCFSKELRYWLLEKHFYCLALPPVVIRLVMKGAVFQRSQDDCWVKIASAYDLCEDNDVSKHWNG